MSYTDDPLLLSANSGAATASWDLAALLAEQPLPANGPDDDGYATTAEEDDLFPVSQSPWDHLLEDFKVDVAPASYPTYAETVVNELLPAALATADLPSPVVPEQATVAGSAIDLSVASCGVSGLDSQAFQGLLDHQQGTATTALLQILTQAALQQLSCMPTVDSVHPETQLSNSVAPRDVSPQRSSSRTPSLSMVSSSPGVPSASPDPNTNFTSVRSDSQSRSPSVTSTADHTDRPKRKRRTCDPSSLIPLDAPIQDRSYAAPSATSRIELDQDDEETQALLAKRRKNTLAARMSRHRKAEQLKTLQDQNAELAEKNARLVQRLYETERLLQQYRVGLLTDGLDGVAVELSP